MTDRCDDYCCNYGCNQGRNCPARKSHHCHGMGYDASGQKCTCQPYEPNNTMAWVLGVLIAVMLVLISIQERT